MKKFFLSLILIGSLNLTAQETTSQFSINFLAPSLEYEMAVSENSTVDLNLGIGFAYRNSAISGEEFGIFPGFEGQYRYFYNLKKRAQKGKKVTENSGNYIAGVASITAGDPIIGDMQYISDYAGYVGPVWGLQRIYNSNFKLNLNLGLGMGFSEQNNVYLAPRIGLQLGFKIGKEK